MFDMFKIMGKMGAIKEAVADVKEELKATELSAQDPQQMVKVIATGAKQIKSIEVDSSALLPENKAQLEEALISATNEALKAAGHKAQETIQETINEKFPEVAGLDIGKYFS